MSLQRKCTTTMNKTFIEKYNMLPKGSHVLCAVSGGKDSVYLLCRLLELSEELTIQVSCAHFDHRLRGQESDRDREFVRCFCQERGIPCYIGRGEVSAFAKEKGLGTEEAARILRYDFLEETAQLIGADRIATAHNADDNAETVLLNMLRGTGLRGLCGIPPLRGRIIRPVLDVSAVEVLEYLEKNGIPHMEDSTNASDDYSRNRLRHQVMPELMKIRGGFTKNLTRASEYLREDEEYLSSAAQAFLDENYKDGSLQAKAFADLPRPISARVLQLIAKGGLSAEHIEAIRDLAAGDKPHACADVPNMRVSRSYNCLEFGRDEAPRLMPRVLNIGGKTRLPEADLTIYTERIKKCSEIHNSFNTFFFKSDTICGNITVESRKDGEKLRLLGRNCTKSLKKLFSEARLNGTMKNLAPVLSDSLGVIAVYGIGMAQRCCALPGDDVIKIEITPAREIN